MAQLFGKLPGKFVRKSSMHLGLSGFLEQVLYLTKHFYRTLQYIHPALCLWRTVDMSPKLLSRKLSIVLSG